MTALAVVMGEEDLKWVTEKLLKFNLILLHDRDGFRGAQTTLRINYN